MAIEIERVRREWLEFCLEAKRLGRTPQEFPLYYFEHTQEKVSLGIFYKLMRDTQNEEVRADFDLGMAMIHSYFSNVMRDVLGNEDATSAQVNALKTWAKVAGGWDDKAMVEINNEENKFVLRFDAGDNELIEYSQAVSGYIKEGKVEGRVIPPPNPNVRRIVVTDEMLEHRETKNQEKKNETGSFQSEQHNPKG